MRNNGSNVLVFIGSIFIGVLIAINMHFGSDNTTVILSSSQYQEAYLKKKNLYAEVSNLKEKYYEDKKKLESYEKEGESVDNVKTEIENETVKNLSLLGYMRVKGPGVLITLNDSDNMLDSSKFQGSIRQRIIHNTDILSLVNELKNLGAEGIAINGERVLINSEINCSGGFISINHRKTPTPFYISVIGDKNVMENYLSENSESYIRILQNRGIDVKIEAKDEIILPKYILGINIKNLSESDK